MSRWARLAPGPVPAWRPLPRLDAPEWLDQGRGSPADVAANLAEMARINRRLGGLSALTRHLYPLLCDSPQPITVLDLGTGAADLPAALAAWARRRGLALRVVGLDSSARCLAVARRAASSAPEVRLLQADARCLPLAPRSVDVVVSSLLLHHLRPQAAAALLRAAFAVARRAVVMSDLVRGRLPLLAFRLAQPVFARHPFTRHDGALSIRRAYTPAELRALAAQAGLPHAEVHTHWPWRQTLVAVRPEGGDG